MEVSIIVLVLLFAIGLLAWRLTTSRRTRHRLQVDALLGPLPEHESGDAELADTGQVRPVSAGAVTPTPAAPMPSAWAPDPAPSTGPTDQLTRLAGSSGARFGLIAGAGLGLGLGLLSIARRRARRRRRIERLRHGARRVMYVANAALSVARDRASELPDGLPVDLDRRASAGGGVALVAALGLLAALRSRQEHQSRAAEARRLAAEAAQAASRRGWRGFRRQATGLAASASKVTPPAVSRQVDRASNWMPSASAATLAAVLLAIRAVQRRSEVIAAAAS